MDFCIAYGFDKPGTVFKICKNVFMKWLWGEALLPDDLPIMEKLCSAQSTEKEQITIKSHD